MPSKLTVNRVIAMTAPTGMHVKTWEAWLENAWSAREACTDEWASGNEEWKLFVGEDLETKLGVPAPESDGVVFLSEPEPEPEPATVPVPVDRDTFVLLVREHLDAKSQGICPQRLALRLSRWGKPSGSEVYVSAKTLAEQVGASRARVNDARLALVRAGWLMVDGHHGRAVMYHLAVPAWSLTSSAAVPVAA